MRMNIRLMYIFLLICVGASTLHAQSPQKELGFFGKIKQYAKEHPHIAASAGVVVLALVAGTVAGVVYIRRRNSGESGLDPDIQLEILSLDDDFNDEVEGIADDTLEYWYKLAEQDQGATAGTAAKLEMDLDARKGALQEKHAQLSDEVLARAIVRVLEQRGYEVHTAKSSGALEHLCQAVKKKYLQEKGYKEKRDALANNLDELTWLSERAVAGWNEGQLQHQDFLLAYNTKFGKKHSAGDEEAEFIFGEYQRLVQFPGMQLRARFEQSIDYALVVDWPEASAFQQESQTIEVVNWINRWCCVITDDFVKNFNAAQSAALVSVLEELKKDYGFDFSESPTKITEELIRQVQALIEPLKLAREYYLKLDRYAEVVEDRSGGVDTVAVNFKKLFTAMATDKRLGNSQQKRNLLDGLEKMVVRHQYKYQTILIPRITDKKIELDVAVGRDAEAGGGDDSLTSVSTSSSDDDADDVFKTAHEGDESAAT